MSKSSGISFVVVGSLVFLVILFTLTSSSQLQSTMFGGRKAWDLVFPAGPIDQANDEESKLLQLWDSFVKNSSNVEIFPRPPHLENCQKRSVEYARLDRRDAFGNRPKWTLWKGEIANLLEKGEEHDVGEFGEELLGYSKTLLQGPLPPWVEGSDEDNLPMTRRVQRDLWLHQHPKNCSDPSLKFLVMDWDNKLKFGLGAQMVHMAGVFSCAMRENRILVLEGLNRASHSKCTGSDFERWSCYFAPETSCGEEVARLKKMGSPWTSGRIRNQDGCNAWFPPSPENWGKPWEHMQFSEASQGKIIPKHKVMERQWWRAQVWRYMMRFPSEYLCTLMNEVRHESFGKLAAKMVLESPPNFPDNNLTREEEMLWDRQRPWMPRPMLFVHVRQGDKASEMKIVGFKEYMKLAHKVRQRFPDVKNIWLSTEMQSVVEESKNYTGWNFFYTRIARQEGTTSMGEYEKSLGTEQASKNSFVNLMMALECDRFVGVLGSTWSFMINAMRTTGGMIPAGFFSVNWDRYWY